eukprot:5299816-Pyramimonas_sp.AAC.2
MDPAQRLLLAGARGALVDGRGDGPAGKAEVTPISRVLGLDRGFVVFGPAGDRVHATPTLYCDVKL